MQLLKNLDRVHKDMAINTFIEEGDENSIMLAHRTKITNKGKG